LHVKITSKHIDVTDAIREHVKDKISKMPKYLSSIKEIEVVLDGKQRGKINVEMIARARRRKVFVVKEADTTILSSVDLASHKLERQLMREKAKMRDNKHKRGAELTYRKKEE